MYRKENNLKECKRLFMAEKEQRKLPLYLKDFTEGIACPLFHWLLPGVAAQALGVPDSVCSSSPVFIVGV